MYIEGLFFYTPAIIIIIIIITITITIITYYLLPPLGIPKLFA